MCPEGSTPPLPAAALGPRLLASCLLFPLPTMPFPSNLDQCGPGLPLRLISNAPFSLISLLLLGAPPHGCPSWPVGKKTGLCPDHSHPPSLQVSFLQGKDNPSPFPPSTRRRLRGRTWGCLVQLLSFTDGETAACYDKVRGCFPQETVCKTGLGTGGWKS